MSDEQDPVAVRATAALDASVETLPPGVATRLAAARSEAIEARTAGVWFRPLGLAACASAAVVALAVLLMMRSPSMPSAPAPMLADGALSADLIELEVALEMDLMEDLEFVAWLDLEDTAAEAMDAS